jgi:hypothetical protein
VTGDVGWLGFAAKEREDRKEPLANRIPVQAFFVIRAFSRGNKTWPPGF